MSGVVCQAERLYLSIEPVLCDILQASGISGLEPR